ncbi:hypothetical protein [Roseateles sp. BYS87W]|uniref:Uncharacterized protein n=1 Tax=Pelomonas baiyunensis TaxID=3299026 RepID=A0ABW7GYA1_9BURK
MNSTTTTTTFSLTARISARMGAWWARHREPRRRAALRRRCPPATMAAGQIPPAVRAVWAQQAPDEFPGLAVDDAAWLRCSLGLAQFFEVCRIQAPHGACALPSKAADSVWHAWLAADAAGLADWQQRHFGRVFDHQETAALGAGPEDALACTWAGACRSEGVALLGPKLPLLFALDGLLRLPTGWAYRHEDGRLVHRQVDGFGRPSGDRVAHGATAGDRLVALGLMSQEELTVARRRQSSDSGGGSGGSSCGSSWSAAGGSSSDASSDGGGSSCGSSCGGGGGGD